MEKTSFFVPKNSRKKYFSHLYGASRSKKWLEGGDAAHGDAAHGDAGDAPLLPTPGSVYSSITCSGLKLKQKKLKNEMVLLTGWHQGASSGNTNFSTAEGFFFCMQNAIILAKPVLF